MSKFKPRAASKDLAEWTRLLDKNKTLPGGVAGPSIKVKLGAWSVNLIGIADEDESKPGVVVDCPAELLARHAELVAAFGAVQEKFGELIKNATAREEDTN